MDDREIAVFVIVLTAVVVPLSLWLAFRIVAKARQKSDRPLSPDGAGGTTVPIRGLKRFYRRFGQSHNSISPQLQIADNGLRFKVFKPDHWLFADIAEVDAPWTPFVTRLVLRHHREGQLWVDLADGTRAADFLRALPPDLPLTRRALAVRSGTG